ncbi:MAG: hypothetical protein K2F77_08935, partial [Muribaculaceae bacterium]|nr:hypothetical protein [Muribaculaceae bacterium]
MAGTGGHIKFSFVRRMLYRMRLWQYAFSRFRLHFSAVLHAVDSVLYVLAAVAALLCIVDLLLYFGFDHNPSDMGLLQRGLRFVQAVFAVNVLFNFVANGRAAFREARLLKWIVDAGVLISLLPWIYPRPEKPWLTWLDALLYRRA